MVRSRESLEQEYRQLTPRSRAQWERGLPLMPGGVIKGFHWVWPYPLYAKRAEGCHIWDLDGRRYLDLFNQASTMILGHNPPEVVKAVREELENGFAFGAPNPKETELARELVERIPSVEKVRFTNSGTEASIHATRLARAATGKPKVAKFEGAYHGSHDALEVSTVPPLDRAGPTDSPTPVAAQKGTAGWAEDSVVVLPYNQPESVELILREHRHEVAAVFYDGMPGMMEVPGEFTGFVRDLTRELGILMVMDEVVSFRAGYGGYQGLSGVEPDLTILGKIVGGGFPVGIVGGKSEYMDLLDNSRGLTGITQGGTFSANNFTLAAGLATLRALTPEVYEHLGRLRLRLENGLEDVFQGAGLPSRIVGAGSIVNVYITDRPVTDYRARASADADVLDRINMGLALKGYAARGGMGFVLSSPMQTADIDGVLTALDEVLQDKD